MATGTRWAEWTGPLLGAQTGVANATRGLFAPSFNANAAGTAPKMSIWVSVAGYIVAVAIILSVILLFVHFTIRPIFQFTPGGSGIIPIPGFSDGKLYWKKAKDVSPLTEATMGISKIPSQNWSFTLDIFIQNPTSLTQNIPVFLREELVSIGTTSNLGPKSNAHIYLVPGTNDLIVGTTNSSNNVEDVVLSNVPVQTPFRVGVVILDVAMEVYVNGRLMKTRVFDAPPGNFTGRFLPPQGAAADLVKVRNLQIWTRPLTASEVRYAKPALMSGSEFEHDKMAGAASSCVQSMENEISSSLTSSLSSLDASLPSSMSSITSNIPSMSSITSSIPSMSSITSGLPSVSSITSSL